MKGRKTLPTNLKVIKGTYRPCRDDKKNTKGSGDSVMVPPEYLSARAKEVFNGLYLKIDSLKYSESSHSDMLGLLAMTLEEIEILSETLNGEMSYKTISVTGEEVHKARPEVKLRSDAARRAQSLLAEFGLSSASSSKVTAKKEKPKNEWEDNF